MSDLPAKQFLWKSTSTEYMQFMGNTVHQQTLLFNAYVRRNKDNRYDDALFIVASRYPQFTMTYHRHWAKAKQLHQEKNNATSKKWLHSRTTSFG
jgi:hypothetical protein